MQFHEIANFLRDHLQYHLTYLAVSRDFCVPAVKLLEPIVDGPLSKKIRRLDHPWILRFWS